MPIISYISWRFNGIYLLVSFKCAFNAFNLCVFLIQINKKVCEILNIKRSLCAPYHPQTNGLVEKMNGTIQRYRSLSLLMYIYLLLFHRCNNKQHFILYSVTHRALAKLVENKPEECNKHLDPVMFGLRTKRQVTTKHSPYFLMFGREARYPSQIPEEYRVRKSAKIWIRWSYFLS